MLNNVSAGLKNMLGEVGRHSGWEWSLGGLGELAVVVAVVVVVGPCQGKGIHDLLLTSVNCGLPPAV